MNQTFGPPSLFDLVQSLLKRCTGLLSDLGCVPIELVLPDVLESCSPEELAEIEDATKAGVSQRRDLSSATWPLWWRHCTALHSSLPSKFDMKSVFYPSPLPPLRSPSTAPPPLPDGVQAADYRKIYDSLQQQVVERREKTGKRLKEMRQEGERNKASRSIKVIAPMLQRQRGKKSNGGGKTQSQSTAKERIMKKLKLSSKGDVKKPKPRILPPPRPLPSRAALAGKKLALEPTVSQKPAKKKKPTAAFT